MGHMLLAPHGERLDGPLERPSLCPCLNQSAGRTTRRLFVFLFLYTIYRGFGFPSLQSSFGTRPTGRSAVRPRRTMAFGRLQELLPGHL